MEKFIHLNFCWFIWFIAFFIMNGNWPLDLITKLIWTLILMFFTRRLTFVLCTEKLIKFYDCYLNVLASKHLNLKSLFSHGCLCLGLHFTKLFIHLVYSINHVKSFISSHIFTLFLDSIIFWWYVTKILDLNEKWYRNLSFLYNRSEEKWVVCCLQKLLSRLLNSIFNILQVHQDVIKILRELWVLLNHIL